ncbi:Signal transducing adapter molecule 1 [Amphibalanus amphitrite]|uniref:Signal transducing adapter molecule 1 n=1 Tax=Amphibalanus amphitrite TaxID=1232801 RepID=A0A6A4X0I4_AMPAM|nr:Signal transducing adapter molecule 1 [Amphibalanus amphitrite]
MGIFSTSSPFDSDVDRVTDEKNTTEDWGLIMDLCDRAAANPKDAMRSIIRQLNHRNPHVQLQTITLLDACVNNSGKHFHLEVASREFEQEFKKHVFNPNTHKRVSSRLLASLQKWAETEFRSDSQLSLIPSLYRSLQDEGLYARLADHEAPPKKAAAAASRDPNVVSSQQEEDDIAKAIALSMKEAEKAPRSSSLYPSAQSVLSSPGPSTSSSGGSAGGAAAAAAAKPERKVRALYDFEAAEDNELTFKAGEIVLVTEDSDPNWWLGSNHRGKGLFPSNFVTSDLSEEPEQWKEERQQRKSVQFNEEVEVNTVERAAAEPVAIDGAKISELLELLNEADPTGDRPDSDHLLALEEQCLAMGPLIDQELERTDRRHAQLTKISSDLVDALNLYHQLMRDTPAVSGYYGPPPAHLVKQYGQPGPMAGAPPPPGGYYGMPPAPPGLPQHGAPQPYPGPGPMMPPMPGHMAGYPQAPPPPHMDGHMGGPPASMGGPPGPMAPPSSMAGGPHGPMGPPSSMGGAYPESSAAGGPLPPPGGAPPPHWGHYAGPPPAEHHFAGYAAAAAPIGPPRQHL